MSDWDTSDLRFSTTWSSASHAWCADRATNGQRIVAERPMYFNYEGVWTGGSDVVGYQQ